MKFPPCEVPAPAVAMVVALSVAACGGRTHRAPGAEGAPAVEAAMRRYAMLLRGAPPDSVAAAYAEAGELVLPGVGTLHGRAAIRDFLAPLAAAVEVTAVDVATDSLTVHGAGAEQWGTYRQVAGERGKAPGVYRGHYAARWQRDADGRWRLSRLVMQPLPADAR